jgi:hypothetical protein
MIDRRPKVAETPSVALDVYIDGGRKAERSGIEAVSMWDAARAGAGGLRA